VVVLLMMLDVYVRFLTRFARATPKMSYYGILRRIIAGLFSLCARAYLILSLSFITTLLGIIVSRKRLVK
jgi:hypothetical protein